MAQQFSLAHLTVLGCPPAEMTYIAARAGYDFVSIRPIFMGLPGEPNYSLADNPQMLRQLKTALAATGLRVHDIELARVYEGLHPTKYLPAMEVAASMCLLSCLFFYLGSKFYQRDLEKVERVAIEAEG